MTNTPFCFVVRTPGADSLASRWLDADGQYPGLFALHAIAPSRDPFPNMAPRVAGFHSQ